MPLGRVVLADLSTVGGTIVFPGRNWYDLKVRKMDTIKLVSDLSTRLGYAIEHGDGDTAIDLVNQLVKLRAKLFIAVDESSINKGTRVRVHIEDRHTDAGCVFMYVSPLMPVSLLKERVFMALGFPPEVQHWIIGDYLASDDDILCNLIDLVEDITLSLYLTTVHAVELGRKGFGDSPHEMLMKSAIYGLDSSIRQEPLQRNPSPKASATLHRPLPKVPELSKKEYSIPTARRPLSKKPMPEKHLKQVTFQSLKASVPVTHQPLTVSNQQSPCINKTQGACIQINPVSCTQNDVKMSERMTVTKLCGVSSTGVGTASNQQHVNKMEPWTCNRCTFAENDPATTACSICDNLRLYVNTT